MKNNIVRLDDVCERGSSNLAQKDITEISGDFPVYGASGYIKDVDFYHQEKEYVAVVKDGAGIGRTMFMPAKSSVIGTLQYLIPKENINPKYLYYAVTSMKLARYFTGATIPHIYFKDYKKEVLPLPDLKKQLEIVSVLEKIEKMIEGKKVQLVEYDHLIKSRFVEIFGDPNEIDSKWDKIPLGELCTIVRGGSPRPINEFLGGNIPWVKIGDATQGDDIYLHSTKEHIIEEGIKKSRYIKEGSLIFANCGVSLGFARIITFKGCIHDGWLAFEDVNDKMDKVFLLKSLNMCTDYFRRTAPDGTQPNLNTTIMKSYMQIVPPIEMQKDFVRFLEHTDKLKFEVQKSLNETQMLFDSLMQEYFE